MKSAIIALLVFFASPFIPSLLANAGEYENRLKEAELAGDLAKVEAICKEWYASGDYSPGLLNWNYNALMSVERNALLFTQKESDTYPAMLLQYALEVRPDIQIISFQLLENQGYRASLVTRAGLLWIPKDCSLRDFVEKILNPEANKATFPKPVYFGSMTDKAFLQTDKQKLYLTGLALKFSAVAFDNVATLRYNYENLFRTDYLEISFEPESDPLTVAQLNLNYLPALLLLHRHYSAAGEPDKADKAKKMALDIARNGGREAELRAFFTPENPVLNIVSAIAPKSLERPMKKVGNRLFAAEVETTNEQYELFLEDLLKNKDFDQLSICRTTKTDWLSLLPNGAQSLSEKVVFKHGHPDGPDHPVQNISHEAALRYCAWITQVYNASTDKKKHKKVLFRLPTESEWMMAARGGIQDAIYPWGGASVQNNKGCYLGNYNVSETCEHCPDQMNLNNLTVGADPNMQVAMVETSVQTETGVLHIESSNDGGFFPVKSNSYFPNNFGLYTVTGNVAEMIAEPGKAKGGSWKDDSLHSKITSLKSYNQGDPTVGFRVFMEIIEE